VVNFEKIEALKSKKICLHLFVGSKINGMRWSSTQRHRTDASEQSLKSINMHELLDCGKIGLGLGESGTRAGICKGDELHVSFDCIEWENAAVFHNACDCATDQVLLIRKLVITFFFKELLNQSGDPLFQIGHIVICVVPCIHIYICDDTSHIANGTFKLSNRCGTNKHKKTTKKTKQRDWRTLFALATPTASRTKFFVCVHMKISPSTQLFAASVLFLSVVLVYTTDSLNPMETNIFVDLGSRIISVFLRVCTIVGFCQLLRLALTWMSVPQSSEVARDVQIYPLELPMELQHVIKGVQTLRKRTTRHIQLHELATAHCQSATQQGHQSLHVHSPSATQQSIRPHLTPQSIRTFVQASSVQPVPMPTLPSPSLSSMSSLGSPLSVKDSRAICKRMLQLEQEVLLFTGFTDACRYI
jgi:hypothetical protein